VPDLALKYRPLMERMSRIYQHSYEIAEQLRKAVVSAESWDAGRGGGHLRFTVPADVAPIETESIEAWALDSDNTPIQIMWHVVDGRLNWGEWIKPTGTAIENWPPHEVSAMPPTYTENGTANLTDGMK
jgi:hypothetical protein